MQHQTPYQSPFQHEMYQTPAVNNYNNNVPFVNYSQYMGQPHPQQHLNNYSHWSGPNSGVTMSGPGGQQATQQQGSNNFNNNQHSQSFKQ